MTIKIIVNKPEIIKLYIHSLLNERIELNIIALILYENKNWEYLIEENYVEDNYTINANALQKKLAKITPYNNKHNFKTNKFLNIICIIFLITYKYIDIKIILILPNLSPKEDINNVPNKKPTNTKYIQIYYYFVQYKLN